MAKAGRGEKSQAVRDYLKANKKAKASDVVSALGEKGIKVSTAMVYALKARKKMGRRRRQASANGQAMTMSISHLLAAKKLVREVGGVAEARAAIDAFAKLL
jgi:hypothetical protein